MIAFNRAVARNKDKQATKISEHVPITKSAKQSNDEQYRTIILTKMRARLAHLNANGNSQQ
jgi:hypothetical protein